MRSTEVARVFGALFGRPDGFGSSDFVRIEFFFFKLYRSILVLGADFVKIMDLFAREGSIFDDL